MADIIKSTNLIKKISRYIFNIIISHISVIRKMNLIKYNKKLQNNLNISLLSYQKLFIKNKIPINFKKEKDKKKLISFLMKEFSLKNKKDIYENMINEIIKEKESFKFEKEKLNLMFGKPSQKLDWNEVNPNVTDLKLYKGDYNSITNINNDNDDEYFKLPSNIFPNLKSLEIAINPKFLIPVSMLTNLNNLTIRMLSDEELLFYNDIIDTEIELNNLEKLEIIMGYNYSDNNDYEEEEEEEDDDNDDGKKKEKKILRILKKENKIKFKCPNLKILIIQIKSDSDFSFLYDYFDFKFLYNIMNEVYTIDNDAGEVYKYTKEKIINYNFNEKMEYFKFMIILKKNNKELIPTFKMKKFKNGLKKYSFKIKGADDVTSWTSSHEKYEENENKNKILKCYKNLDDLHDIDKIEIDNLNIVKIRTKDRKENFDINNKLEKLFHMEKNNYSVQQIGLNTDEINKNFFGNISKFKLLKSIIIRDIIKDSKTLIKFIEDISGLHFLEKIGIIYYGKLTKNEKNLIKNKIKDIVIKEEGAHFEIKKNFWDFERYFTGELDFS